MRFNYYTITSAFYATKAALRYATPSAFYLLPIFMFDQLKNSTKSWALKFIQAITVVGTTLLITLSVNANPSSKAVQKEIAEIFKKNPDKQIVVKVENQSTNEETAIEMLGGNDTINALDFAVQNVDKYYPDMKEHLDNLLESFRDQE